MIPHKEKVKQIQEAFYQALKKGNLSLGEGESKSSQTRSAAYKTGGRISINALDEVLEIDEKNLCARVEPRVSMETLVDKTLEKGLIPLVVPEFKGITVGGAIMGAGLESTSWREGQFNDGAIEYELLLGNGETLTATEKSFSDLFYAVSGSYGTLATLLCTKLKLTKAKPYVNLTFEVFDSFDKALLSLNSPSYFTEGVALSPSCIFVLKGELSDTPDNKPTPLSNSGSLWMISHLSQNRDQKKGSFTFSLKDYLFRFDKGAFWMGAYALEPILLGRYFLNQLGISGKWQKKLDFKKISYPGRLFSLLSSPFSSSRFLYKLLHFGSENWFGRRFVIQDFYLPKKQAGDFFKEADTLGGVFPIWLCPIRGTQTHQILSPHFQNEKELINIGIYGYPTKKIYGDTLTKELEKACFSHGGKKMLYAQTYYSEEAFWKIYDRTRYETLRQSYGGIRAFPSITDKLLLH